MRPFNGVVLVAQGETVIYSKASGFADFQTRRPIKLSDTFRIQSQTKQVTAVLVLKEVERGRINLNEPISTYLADMEQPWARLVTSHQLLNMTSGIRTLDEDLLFEPGTDYYYSNPGYGLLGAILKAVTGQSYCKLADQLFKDTGLENSYCFQYGGDKHPLDGHIDTGDGLHPVAFEDIGFTEESWERFAPAAGIISNAMDLLKWEKMLHGAGLLSPAMYHQMTSYSITARHSAFGDDALGYGYGLRIDNTSPVKHLGHAGRGLGFASLKFYVPEYKTSVIILENVYIYKGQYDSNTSPDEIYHFERRVRQLVLDTLAKESSSLNRITTEQGTAK